MPNLALGRMAKDAARQRFQSFNITLPPVGGGGSPPLQGVAARLMQGQLARATGVAGTATPTLRPVGAALRPGLANAAPALAPAPAQPTKGTPMSLPPALFRAASDSLDDVAYQRGLHELFSGLFDNIIDAIEFGFNAYRTQAGLVDVVINGPIAMGGRLEGPAMDVLITRAPSVVAWSGWEAMVRDAVAKGFGQQWATFERSIMVPSLPWYPMFIAFPGPKTPPTPNVPTPLLALAPMNLGALFGTGNLKMAMRAALNGQMDYCMEFFDALSTVLQGALPQWVASQQVTRVMGTGPVPTFAPPYVPVGPVVGGSVLRGSHIDS